jgi:hypothetical protein
MIPKSNFEAAFNLCRLSVQMISDDELHPDELPAHKLPHEIATQVELALLAVARIRHVTVQPPVKNYMMDWLALKLSPAQVHGAEPVINDEFLEHVVYCLAPSSDFTPVPDRPVPPNRTDARPVLRN